MRINQLKVNASSGASSYQTISKQPIKKILKDDTIEDIQVDIRESRKGATRRKLARTALIKLPNHSGIIEITESSLYS